MFNPLEGSKYEVQKEVGLLEPLKHSDTISCFGPDTDLHTYQPMPSDRQFISKSGLPVACFARAYIPGTGLADHVLEVVYDPKSMAVYGTRF